ncbi:MAG TPA: HEAT repeat domain-containing protein [Roseiflexaceae bacterium]|nr:HEAT repeat domain-containing protein [Roseiflexaceae bacterium]
MEEERVPIPTVLRTIGASSRRLAMVDLKGLSSLGAADRAEFWPLWQKIADARRAEIAHATVELSEDNVDLDFAELWYWLLEDDSAPVRVNAVEGLWEDTSMRVLRRMLGLLRQDPSEEVRAAAAVGLGHYAYTAALGELDSDELAEALAEDLLAAVRDEREPLEVRRRALESAGYFSDSDAIQQQIERAFRSDEQLLRESALVAMGRSMLERWLPTIAGQLESPSPALRYEAARAAGEMADTARSLLGKLLPLLNDSDTEVALAAIWAMGQIGGERAKRALQQVRKSGDPARSQAAEEALEELTLGDSPV